MIVCKFFPMQNFTDKDELPDDFICFKQKLAD